MKKAAILFPVVFLFGTVITEAQITNLHSFYDTGSDGSYPYGSLLKEGSVLYGMTRYGGRNDEGSIFSIHTDGSGYKDLWDFHENGSSNGAYPFGSLILVGNKLFGMTSAGGTINDGNIFSINTDGTGYKDLQDFNGTNGQYPYSTLTNIAGKLFGFTYRGGTNGDGVIFSIDTSGNNFKDILQFNQTNGQYPDYGAFSVSASGKVLYGTTSEGGTDDFGLVYAIDTDGTRFRDLHDFDFTDGEYPYGSVMLSGNKLFGTTYNGYPSFSEGVVYTVDTAGNNFKLLLGFTFTDGEYPEGDLVISGKKMWGMTNQGGLNNKGLIFSIDTAGSNYADLFDFNNVDGEYPVGSLTLTGGDTLYGMTNLGGANVDGVVFRFISAGLGVNTISAIAGVVNIYPNPSNGKFTFVCHPDVNQADHGIISIYDLFGSHIITNAFWSAQGDVSIDMTSQPSGMYFYKITAQNGDLIGQGKIIIQK